MSISGEWVELAAGLRGYYARPDGTGPFPAIVIYMEAFGLNAHIKRLTARLAAAGFAAIAPDTYAGAVYEYTDLPGAVGHMKRLADDAVVAQSQQALDFLRGRPEVRGDAVGALGFCMGGRHAFLVSAALGARFAAAAAFYGGGIASAEGFLGRPNVIDQAAGLQAPLLLFYGGQDQFIRPDEHGRIAASLSLAGKQYTLTVFPRATHGFFCEERSSYNQEAAERSWRATLAFFHEYLGA